MCLTIRDFSQDVIGCTQEMDFILWPRNDIEKIVCLLFSRWKGAEDEPFRPVQVRQHITSSAHVLLELIRP